MAKKIGVISLGCPKNLVDSEIILGILKDNGFEIVNDERIADIIVVNTCGFIESAKQESINTILEMSSYKSKSCELLVVVGCLSQRYMEEILEEIPEVDICMGTSNYGDIAEAIKTYYTQKIQKGNWKSKFCDPLEGIEYLESRRVLSTSNHGYAYVKIAEGCDNCCTYCIIPKLRGMYRSRRIENIVKDVENLTKEGIKEIVIIAQDTTMYGKDVYGSVKLVELIREISKIEGVEWIRLLYCYPELINEHLVEEIRDNEKVCNYIDVPIQHVSNKVLKTMGRRGKFEDIDHVLKKLRERIPGVVIRTSLIVGFPGENEDDFRKLYNYVKDFEFDRLGVFKYSREEGTPAAEMKEQVSREIKNERYDIIMKLQKGISDKKNRDRINTTYKTLVEGVSEDGIFYYGRTYAEAPDIDGSIYFTSREPLEDGCFASVKVLNADNYDLTGEVNYEFAK